jgi:hypothetical protein
MLETKWDYSRAELESARVSNDMGDLSELARHKSSFVRAQVAGNRNCPPNLRQQLSQDPARGVVMWLIQNPVLTKKEFNEIFAISRKGGYCDVVTPALANSPLADIEQLKQLSRENTWNIKLSILSNFNGRGDSYTKLIEQYLAKADTDHSHWTEIEKIAHFRLTGNRNLPEAQSGS